MIFACLTPGTPLDLDSYYGALLEEFADSGLKDWTFLGSTVLEAPNLEARPHQLFRELSLCDSAR